MGFWAKAKSLQKASGKRLGGGVENYKFVKVLVLSHWRLMMVADTIIRMDSNQNGVHRKVEIALQRGN